MSSKADFRSTEEIRRIGIEALAEALGPLDAVRFLLRADQAEPLLAHIPDEALLENGTDEQIAAAGELIDLFDNAYQLGRGKVTKVLYLKRPGFIPVIDPVVGDFLWKNFPFLLRQSSSTERVLRVYQMLLQARTGVLDAVRAGHLAELGIAQVTDTPGGIPVYCVSVFSNTGGMARRDHGDERDGRDPHG